MSTDTTPAETTPETFSFVDWFADANLPESSADIYLNAAVLADLADVERRLALEAAAVETEKTLGTQSKKRLEKEWAALAQKFEDSKITVYCRALTSVRRTEIRAEHDLAQKNDGEANQGFVFRCLAASIVGMKKAGGERTPATLTQAQVEDLYTKVGDAQIGRINDAYLTATNAIPTVDADFLRKLSGPESGLES
jgi:hypothetical protein